MIDINRAQTDLDPAFLAVWAQENQLATVSHRPKLGIRGEVIAPFVMRLTEIDWDKGIDGASDQLLSTRADQYFGKAVGVGDAAALIYDQNGIGKSVENVDIVEYAH